jgi:type II secretory pathway pseudopilin PulG
MGSTFHRRKTSRNGERGYVLLTLLLILALMIIAAAAIVPTIKFEIERDREEELIHRGVQYSRAIRAYYKKFGRYPTKLEDLESANNIRFLRKRYKDPITGQDFKLLHFGEVKLTFTGGVMPGVNAVGTPIGASPNGDSSGLGQSGPGQLGANGQSAFGQSSFGQSSFGQSSFGQNSSFGGAPNGGTSNSPFGQNQQNGQGTTNSSSSDGSNGSNGGSTDASSTGSNGNSNGGAGNSPGNNGPGDQLSGQVFGGGPVVGVVSLSKKDTIREFNHKKKYNEWQFIYDPGTDRGGLLMTPNQPTLQGFGQPAQNLNGQNGTNSSNGSPNGNSSSFGNSLGNSPSSFQNNQNSSFGNSNQQSSPQQQPPQ